MWRSVDTHYTNRHEAFFVNHRFVGAKYPTPDAQPNFEVVISGIGCP